MTQGERITALEIEVRLYKVELMDMNKKLDDLIALRNKGAGAFWLASALFGTTLVGLIGTFFGWIKL